MSTTENCPRYQWPKYWPRLYLFSYVCVRKSFIYPLLFIWYVICLFYCVKCINNRWSERSFDWILNGYQVIDIMVNHKRWRPQSNFNAMSWGAGQEGNVRWNQLILQSFIVSHFERKSRYPIGGTRRTEFPRTQHTHRSCVKKTTEIFHFVHKIELKNVLRSYRVLVTKNTSEV